MRLRYVLILLVLLIAIPLFLFFTRGKSRQYIQSQGARSSVADKEASINEAASQENIQASTSPDVISVDSDNQMKEPLHIQEKSATPPRARELNLRLVGTVLGQGEQSYAVIVDEETGMYGNYRVGDSIKEMTVLELHKDSIVLEKDGMTQKLIFSGSSSEKISPFTATSGPEPSVMGVRVRELPPFDPVVSETGPPVDETITVKDLPPFEPITNKTGPPVDPNIKQQDLPPFEPIVSETGPPG